MHNPLHRHIIKNNTNEYIKYTAAGGGVAHGSVNRVFICLWFKEKQNSIETKQYGNKASTEFKSRKCSIAISPWENVFQWKDNSVSFKTKAKILVSIDNPALGSLE